jgi:hypothetical protein
VKELFISKIIFINHYILNPLKEESMEGEKSQYTLPDGSSIEVIHI